MWYINTVEYYSVLRVNKTPVIYDNMDEPARSYVK